MTVSSPARPDNATGSPPSSEVPSAMSSGLVVLVLSLLLGIQPITTDVYLPALPALTQGFGAPMTQAQLTLTALLLAFGISQLVLGPLSDRFGRRPVLLWGMGAYTAASTACALAPSMEMLIFARTVQGAAMGAAVMCARALVRDLYTPELGARAMSRGLTGLGVIACLCAPVGGVASDILGWRAALAVTALFGAGTFTILALRFRETLATPNPRALEPRMIAGNWWHIVRNPTFIAHCALSAASYGGLFTFLASSSFVFIQVLGLSKTQYGFVMFAQSFIYIFGTLLCRRLLPRLGVKRSVKAAAFLTIAGGTLMGVLSIAGVRAWWAILGPFALFMLGHGVHQPCSQSGAVSQFPQAAGAASALNGFVMMLVAFGMGGWLGRNMDGTVFPLTLGIWFWSIVIATVAWTLVQRHGDARKG